MKLFILVCFLTLTACTVSSNFKMRCKGDCDAEIDLDRIIESAKSPPQAPLPASGTSTPFSQR